MHEQAERFLPGFAPSRSEARCTGAHSCLTSVTGPFSFHKAVHDMFNAGCAPAVSGLGGRGRGAAHRPWGGAGRSLAAGGRCRAPGVTTARDVDLLLATYRCSPAWLCGHATHWDCRNSRKKRDCGKWHYTYRSGKTIFFNLSVGRSYRRRSGPSSVL